MPYDPYAGALPATTPLSKKYGREIINYFSDSPLNRLSFLRPETPFLRSCLPCARFLPLNNLLPLTSSPSRLAFVSYTELAPLLDSLDLYKTTDEEWIAEYDSVDPRYRGASVVFLGLDGGKEKKGLYTRSLREHRETAGILAQAKSLIDWNARNQFCAACGSKTISVQAGTKRVCPPTDKASPEPRPSCLSRTGIHNIAVYPSVIMAIINHTGDKILLGRQSRWPPGFYSTLAGFLEPGESLDSAVRRETWEESGVRVGRVIVHSSQPWPYPANIMIGCIGEAVKGGEEINLGYEKELEDAKWWGMEEVRRALGSADWRAIGSGGERKEVEEEGKGTEEEIKLRLPGGEAIAHQLISAVVEGYYMEKELKEEAKI
ncbi:NUDIX hydrolase domain-like protein [Kalaharituber pfeilii]|nr:NUDIX hydrolase domain-like protein [Kalaharituber pfeilii]